MAGSPAHRFGQIIGDILEEICLPLLEEYCGRRGLFLDKKGARGARNGKKVSWEDRYGNSHDLDFVIEKHGSAQELGRPCAFIEAAWRRYTKHSKNKAQEIQGAIIPIAEKHHWDKPFIGAILAGDFTGNSITQLRSNGFEVMLFPYETIVDAFLHVGIDVLFDEATPDDDFQDAIDLIEALSAANRMILKDRLVELNRPIIDDFISNLACALDRRLTRIILIPLHGQQHEFASIAEAKDFIEGYDQDARVDGVFLKYEIIARYSNGDNIDASFDTKERAVSFLDYISQH